MPEETVEESLNDRWQKAIDIAPSLLKIRDPNLSPEKLEEERQAVETAIRDLSDSKSLKVVVNATQDGQDRRSIEPDWSESYGFGLPVDLFAGAMGLDTPHIYDHADFRSGELLGILADAAQKPVSAVVNGEYIEAVSPQVPSQAA